MVVQRDGVWSFGLNETSRTTAFSMNRTTVFSEFAFRNFENDTDMALFLYSKRIIFFQFSSSR